MNSPRSRMRARFEHEEANQDVIDQWITASLIKALKPSPQTRNQIYEEAQRVGHSRPFITDFRETFPDFPVYLAVRERLALKTNAGLSNLFPSRKALSQPFIKQYFDLFELEAHEIGDRFVGMLIRWPPQLAVVIHNVPIRHKRPDSVSMTFTTPEGKVARLEPLEQFVSLIREQLPEDF